MNSACSARNNSGGLSAAARRPSRRAAPCCVAPRPSGSVLPAPMEAAYARLAFLRDRPLFPHPCQNRTRAAMRGFQSSKGSALHVGFAAPWKASQLAQWPIGDFSDVAAAASNGSPFVSASAVQAPSADCNQEKPCLREALEELLLSPREFPNLPCATRST